MAQNYTKVDYQQLQSNFKRMASLTNFEIIDYNYVLQNLFSHTGDNLYRFSITNLIGLFLSLGSSGSITIVRGDISQNQREIYLIQTSAIAIVANWDVQEQLLALQEERFRAKDASYSFTSAMRIVFGIIDSAVESINPCITSAKCPPMAVSHLKKLSSFVNVDDNRSFFQWILRTLGDLLSVNYLEEICKIYQCAGRLLQYMRQDPENEEMISAAWTNLVDVVRTSKIQNIEQKFNMDALSKGWDLYWQPESAKKRPAAIRLFKEKINRQLKKLCTESG